MIKSQLIVIQTCFVLLALIVLVLCDCCLRLIFVVQFIWISMTLLKSECWCYLPCPIYVSIYSCGKWESYSTSSLLGVLMWQSSKGLNFSSKSICMIHRVKTTKTHRRQWAVGEGEGGSIFSGAYESFKLFLFAIHTYIHTYLHTYIHTYIHIFNIT